MTLRFLTAGESHGPAMVTILEGLPAGLPLTEQMINQDLARRQEGLGTGARMKIEHDQAVILSGVMEGKTIGSPLAIMIKNLDHERWKDRSIPPSTIPRPGHADLAGVIKYGFNDLRPVLERASARETAARVAIGAVCRQFLAQFSIQIGGYVTAIGEINASLEDISLEDRIRLALQNDIHCPDPNATQIMQQAIRQIMQEKDTLGGIIEAAALNVPPGLGSYVHWDRRLDARIAAAILSIPAIKGVEIGPAFENSRLKGTVCHDPVALEGDELIRLRNRSGGIEGGVSNGSPIIVRAAMKPIPTTLSPQRSVHLLTGIETTTKYERSDFCPVPRAVVIVEAMLAFVLADALLEKLGGDTLADLHTRYQLLRKARLNDLKLSGDEHIFWSESKTV
ncbi:MAG: chorismate synthase [Anaerolineales bacterium]